MTLNADRDVRGTAQLVLEPADAAFTARNAPSTRVQEATAADYRLTQPLPEARTDGAGDWDRRGPTE